MHLFTANTAAYFLGMTPDSPEFDFYISATSESDVAQEVARVLRDAGYTIYLPERKDEAATKRFAASKSKAFVLPLMNDNQQSQFLADILNFAPLGIAEGRVVVIQFEDCELAGLIDPNLITNLSGLTNSRARKLRIINAVEVPLPPGAPTEADEVPPPAPGPEEDTPPSEVEPLARRKRGGARSASAGSWDRGSQPTERRCPQGARGIIHTSRCHRSRRARARLGST